MCGKASSRRRYIIENGVQKEAFTVAYGTPSYGTSGGYFTITATIATHIRTLADVDGSKYTKCVIECYTNNPNNSAFFCAGQTELNIPTVETTLISATEPSVTNNYAEIGLYQSTVYVKNMYFE